MIPIILLQGTSQAPAGGEQSPNPFGNLFVMFGFMFFIFYILVLRPQRKRDRERLEMLSSVKKNDRVLTSGGIHGLVMSVKDDEVSLRVDV